MKRLALALTAVTAFAGLAVLPTAAVADVHPLLAAARANDVDRVSGLLQAGVDPDLAGATGTTALHLASSLGYTELARLLIDAGADVDAAGPAGNTALMLAAQDGHVDIVTLLIGADADVDARSDAGGSAMKYAAAYGHRQIVAAIDATRGPAFVTDAHWKWLVAGFVLALSAGALALTRMPLRVLRPATARAA